MSAFASVSYDAKSSNIEVWCIALEFTRPKRIFPLRHINLKEVNSVIEEYWLFVDQKIRQKILDVDDKDVLTDFMDESKSRGNEITNLLFTHEVQKELWKTAAESDIFVISSNLATIPFEALYSSEYGQSGTFLSDNCVIQRTLENGRNIENDATVESPFTSIVCLDSELANEEEELDAFLFDELNRQKIQLVRTSTRSAFSESIKNASVVHWLCEHSSDGLRLKKGIYFNQRDVDVCKFPRDSVLFMLTCQGGKAVYSNQGEECSSISADIAAACGCTVVAPSSIVAASAAFKFVVSINSILSEEKVSKLSDVWSLIKNDLGGRESASGITAHKCYLLWFGIYGDCNVSIKTGVKRYSGN